VVLELLDLVSRRRGVRELRREPGLATMAGLPAVATIHRALVRVPLILVVLVAAAPRIGLGRAELHGSRVVGRVVLAGITREHEPWAVWIILLIAAAVAVKRAYIGGGKEGWFHMVQASGQYGMAHLDVPAALKAQAKGMGIK